MAVCERSGMPSELDPPRSESILDSFAQGSGLRTGVVEFRGSSGSDRMR